MKLYHYDHCPYCVKARVGLGLTQTPYTLLALSNDDEATPSALIGKKMVPILVTQTGKAMPESMDIVRYVDALKPNPIFDQSPTLFGPLLEGARRYLYALTFPRWVRMDLPEFATDTARRYFTSKKEAMMGKSFAQLREETPHYLLEATRHLASIAPLFAQQETLRLAKQPDRYNEDYIHLFALLRALSCVEGLSFPPALTDFAKNISQKTDIKLHDIHTS
jgi:glutaredoxin 2